MIEGQPTPILKKLNLAEAKNGRLLLGTEDFRLRERENQDSRHVALINIAGVQIEYPIEIVDDVNVTQDYFDMNRGVVVMPTVF